MYIHFILPAPWIFFPAEFFFLRVTREQNIQKKLSKIEIHFHSQDIDPAPLHPPGLNLKIHTPVGIMWSKDMYLKYQDQ